MIAEELNNQFGAVLNENVGEVTNNVNANALPKAAGAFLMSNNRYSHTVRIGNAGVTYPTFFVASFDGTAHHVSCNTCEDKVIYEDDGHEINRKVVKDFQLSNWKSSKIVFEETVVCTIFDPQKGDFMKRRTSLYHCDTMTPEEQEVANAVREAWNAAHPKKA
jgi:hypothetical protein